jgi:hypothetical protein
MNLDRLTTGEKILGACGAVLFLFSFVSLWGKIETKGAGIGNATVRFNAWDGYGFHVKLAIILGLVAAALVIAKAAEVKIDMPWGLVYLGVGGLALLLLLIGLLTGPAGGGGGSAFGFSVEVSRGIGLFIGVLLSAGMAYGGWMFYNEESAATTATGPTTPDAPPPAV